MLNTIKDMSLPNLLNVTLSISEESEEESEEFRPMAFNVQAVQSILDLYKGMTLQRVRFVDESVWHLSGGLLELKDCHFSASAYCNWDDNNYKHQPPLKVKFSELNDQNTPDAIKFLNSLLRGIERGRIDQVIFNDWKSTQEQEPIMNKLAELSRKLPDGMSDKKPDDLTGGPALGENVRCLVLSEIVFSHPQSMKTMNVRKHINESNRRALEEATK